MGWVGYRGFRDIFEARRIEKRICLTETRTIGEESITRFGVVFCRNENSHLIQPYESPWNILGEIL